MPRFSRLTAGGMVLLMVWGSSQTAPARQQSPLTVCDVLQSLDKYRGRIVEVRGEYDGGELRASCPPLKTEGYIWISAIQLELPQNSIVKEENPTQWTYDLSANQAAVDRGLAMQRAGGAGTVVMATVAGRLDAREPLMVVTAPGREPTPIGYGHLGIYPARLILVRITDIRAEKK